MKKVLLACLALCLLAACGPTKKAANNPEVRQFLARFDKEKFLEEIAAERARHEQTAKTVKAANAATPVLIEKYRAMQRDYNAVLDQMTTDLKAVKNIIGFKAFDANTRYHSQLEKARKSGSDFTAAAQAIPPLAEKLPLGSPILAFSKMVLYPLAQKLHERYLAYCKSQMEVKINALRFKDWESL